MEVILFDELDQVSFLELELDRSGIDYQKVSPRDHAPILQPPYLLVDGAPLDMFRAFKWIKEHENGC